MKGSILFNHGFDFYKWYQFIDGVMASNMSLNKVAKRCGISTVTANEWVRYLFFAVELLQKNDRLSGDIEADETFIKTNYKNLKGKKAFKEAKILRKAHRRGQQTSIKDLQKDEISVVCAIDDNGNCVAKITGIGTPSGAMIAEAIGAAAYCGARRQLVRS